MKQAKRTCPLIIGVAVSGAEDSPRKYPFIPVTAEEAVKDAVELMSKDLVTVTFTREPCSGDQFADRDWFENVRRSRHPR